MKSDTIYQLVHKFFYNHLPEKLQQRFRQWWINDLHRSQKDNSMEQIWNEINIQADASTYKELEKLQVRMNRQKPQQKQVYIQRLLRIAAFFLLPLSGGLLVYLAMPEKIHYIDPQWTEHFVYNGEKEKLRLSDGSEVWLNSGSLLLYASGFEGNERRLYLNGEAIFQVTPNPEKPFIVKTNHLEVEVLGTIFNLKAYPESDFSTITLEEGSLKVRAGTNEDQIFYLKPDEQVIYNHSSGIAYKEKTDAGRVLQWKDGYLIFRNTSFEDIIKTLERHFDVTIHYETDKFTGRTFTMRFNPDEDITQILEVMKEIIKNMNYKIRENSIYIN